MDGLLPPQLLALIDTIERGEPVDPALLSALSRWRLACGDARAAARWQRWSLQPPDQGSLREALRQILIWLERPDLMHRLGAVEGWNAVALALEQHNPTLGLELQERALANGEPPEPRLTLLLAGQWQQQGQPEAALALLELLAMQHSSPALFNAIAHQLDQLQRHNQAAPWWDRSLALEPNQLPALIARTRNALRQNTPHVAMQLSQRVLQRDPTHTIGLELRLSALQQLGAKASMRQALVPLLQQDRNQNIHRTQELQAWWKPRRRRQKTWRQAIPAELQNIPKLLLAPPKPIPPQLLSGCSAIALAGSRDGLELVGAFRLAAPQGVLWDIASREPLCSQANLQRLIPAGWELRVAGNVDRERHESLEAVIRARGWSGPELRDEGAAIWAWSKRRQGWESVPRPGSRDPRGSVQPE